MWVANLTFIFGFNPSSVGAGVTVSSVVTFASSVLHYGTCGLFSVAYLSSVTNARLTYTIG
jgi:hypothetical protein